MRENVTATRVRGGNLDRTGRRIPLEAEVQFVAAFAPGDSRENHEYREDTTTRATLYVRRIGLDVKDTDTILTSAPFKGRWAVDGDPDVWLSPYTGQQKGTVIPLIQQ